jgi:hypothetical protein
MKASIDQLVDKLERQVKRYRERRIVEPRRHTEHNGVEPRGGDQRGGDQRAGEQPDEGRAADRYGGSS